MLTLDHPQAAAGRCASRASRSRPVSMQPVVVVLAPVRGLTLFSCNRKALAHLSHQLLRQRRLVELPRAREQGGQVGASLSATHSPSLARRADSCAVRNRASRAPSCSRALRLGWEGTASGSRTVRPLPPSLALALLEVLTAALPADEGNEALYAGPHVSDFGDQLERTQYMALGVPPGMVWQAKSASLARSTLALSSISSRR